MRNTILTLTAMATVTLAAGCHHHHAGVAFGVVAPAPIYCEPAPLYCEPAPVVIIDHHHHDHHHGHGHHDHYHW